MAVQIQIRRGTATEWTSANPTLLQGEAGLETNTGRLKYGDGVTAWNSLPYFLGDTPSIFVSETTPAGLGSGDLWLDTSATV
jgi:hypothetical protein